MLFLYVSCIVVKQVKSIHPRPPAAGGTSPSPFAIVPSPTSLSVATCAEPESRVPLDKILTKRCADYTHVIFIGANELSRVVQAITRYTLGGEGYVDPVDFNLVFDINADTGLPEPTFTPMIEVGSMPQQYFRLCPGDIGVFSRLLCRPLLLPLTLCQRTR